MSLHGVKLGRAALRDFEKLEAKQRRLALNELGPWKPGWRSSLPRRLPERLPALGTCCGVLECSKWPGNLGIPAGQTWARPHDPTPPTMLFLSNQQGNWGRGGS